MGWLSRAESDLAYAQLGLNAGPYYYAGVLYHCQQTAEKALKSLCCFHGIIPPKTHDLVRLLEIIQPHADLEERFEDALFLNPFATIFRYPGDEQEPTTVEAGKAVLCARSLLAAIRERVIGETA